MDNSFESQGIPKGFFLELEGPKRHEKAAFGELPKALWKGKKAKEL